MPEFYIKREKNPLRWSATKVLKKRQMSFLHIPINKIVVNVFSQTQSSQVCSFGVSNQYTVLPVSRDNKELVDRDSDLNTMLIPK